MSSYDAAPLPRLGEVFFDVRGDSRSMRLSWYGDTGVAVFSIWQGGRCTGTFRLPVDELPRMVAMLQQGPDDGLPDPGYGPNTASHSSSASRHDPGPAPRDGSGYPLADAATSYLAGPPPGGYATDLPDYPAGDSRDYDYGAGDARDAPRYAAGDGHDYLTGEGPPYPPAEGHDYAGDDRGYPRYPAGEGRDYPPREGPGYLTGERRDYAAGDAPDYRPADRPGSAAAAPDSDPYRAWAGPESAGHPQARGWPDDYQDSEAARYGPTPPGPRQDRRLAAESRGGAGRHGQPLPPLPGPARLG